MCGMVYMYGSFGGVYDFYVCCGIGGELFIWCVCVVCEGVYMWCDL